MEFDLKQPCDDCPFRCDKPNQRGWLGEERAKDIINTLYRNDQTFACHKTTGHRAKKQQHCAGAMILMERTGKANQLMRCYERIGYYDRNKLVMDSPVFDTKEQFIAWHGGSEVETEYNQRQAQAAAKEQAKPVNQPESPAESQETAQWMQGKATQMDSFLKNLEQQGINQDSFGVNINADAFSEQWQKDHGL